MDRNLSTERTPMTPLSEPFERYLQDKGKGRGGDGGNYRRNAARELERFAEWTAGDRGGEDWTGIIPGDIDRDPTSPISTSVSSANTSGISLVTVDSNRTRYKLIIVTSLHGVADVSTRGISKHTTHSGRVRWCRCRRTAAVSPATSKP